MRRREFLTAMGVGVGAAACASGSAARAGSSAARRRARTVPDTDFDIRRSYPAMAALGDETYSQRRARIRELARAERCDLVLATSGATSFAYLAGADYGRSERLTALLLPVDGEPLLLAPSFEVSRVRKSARAVDVRGWQESEDPIGRIREWIGEGRRISRLLLEPRTDYAVAAALSRAIPDLTLVDGSRAFEELRLAKTDAELERMRRAIVIIEDAFAAAFSRLEIGMREKDVARIVREEVALRGAEGGALVQFGANAAFPHGAPSEATLADGMVVLLDGGCSVQGWVSDITRTRWFGEPAPPGRFRTIYNLVHDAQTAAIAAVRPGVAAQAIDRAAREVIARAGFGAQFTHRLGHGMGMDGHEAAYMVEGNTRPLAPGFVFSVEPGIYLPDEFGVRLEDDVACGPSGADVMSRRAPRI